MNFRLKQISENIHHELSRIINEAADSKWGLTTITGVNVSSDLRQAKVWIAAKPETIATLNLLSHDFYKLLRPRLKIKRIPKIIFYPEDEKGNRVDQIIEELHES